MVRTLTPSTFLANKPYVCLRMLLAQRALASGRMGLTCGSIAWDLFVKGARRSELHPRLASLFVLLRLLKVAPSRTLLLAPEGRMRERNLHPPRPNLGVAQGIDHTLPF